MSNLNGNANSTSTPPDASTEQVSTYVDTIFQRLEPRDVEQFYKSYHSWLLQRRIQTLHTEASAIQQAIIDNTTLMQHVSLSAIALASLAQLQASGVNDLNLLDRMLERGEAWLDHTMQLLEHCEKLDIIRSDYTQWCEHALEGAYDWIESVEATEAINQLENNAINNEQPIPLHTATEEQLLQKLMRDKDATEKIATLNSLLNEARARKITRPLDQNEAAILDTPTHKITQPLDQIEEAPSPARKTTQPLDHGEPLIETDLPEETAISTPAEQSEPTNATSSETPLQPETLLPQEESADDTEQTATMPALIIKQISEPQSKVDAESSLDNSLESEEVHTEQPLQIDDTKHVTEAHEEGSQEIIIQENKKPQPQKVRHNGFWRLLNRLLAFILRR
ncbi:MAG: hypothetical protein H0V70_03615 [Ktedonobacteraceae bacterium]|nr:hypothetical protein [Ktedonobacteraceae bacterium]